MRRASLVIATATIAALFGATAVHAQTCSFSSIASCFDLSGFSFFKSDTTSETTKINLLPPTGTTTGSFGLEVGDVTVSDLTGTSAKISWTTNLLAAGTVRYGTSEKALDKSVSVSSEALSQTVTIPKLQPFTDYFFAVTATTSIPSSASSAVQQFKTPVLSHDSIFSFSPSLLALHLNTLSLYTPSSFQTLFSATGFAAQLQPGADRLLCSEERDISGFPSITAGGVRIITSGEATHVKVTYISPAIGVKDSDGDGLTDSDESAGGTNPNDRDTDHDGKSDCYEVFVAKTNPTAE